MPQSQQNKNNILHLSWSLTGEHVAVPVLYEDDYLLVIDKPSGWLTSPDGWDPKRANIMGMIHEGIREGKGWARSRGLTYLMNAHRLDKDSSGILVLAKSKETLRELVKQFSDQHPTKVYLALVHGVVLEERFIVDLPLAHHPSNPQFVIVDRGRGKRAITKFEVAEHFVGYTLMRCYPITGRTHQIRVHIQRKGHPVVADPLYGGRPLYLSSLKPNYRLRKGSQEKPLIGRLALHAWKITLIHPVKREPIEITSPLPRDFEVTLKYLRRYAATTSTFLSPSYKLLLDMINNQEESHPTIGTGV